MNTPSQEGRPVSMSRCIMSEIVLPNDTNSLGNLMGGRLLHWMDICAAISSQRHAGCVCVTASVDTVEFHGPIQVSEIVVLESRVNRAFRTSMEIEILVDAENPRTGHRRRCNTAFYTFVAVGPDGSPIPVPAIIPESPDEKERFESAATRREFRLLVSGRLPLKNAGRVHAYLDSLREKDVE